MDDRAKLAHAVLMFCACVFAGMTFGGWQGDVNAGLFMFFALVVLSPN
jgi:hypothetical protein